MHYRKCSSDVTINRELEVSIQIGWDAKQIAIQLGIGVYECMSEGNLLSLEMFRWYFYFVLPLYNAYYIYIIHLADAFIQSDLHCIQVTVSKFYQLLLSLGIEPMILALLAPCSTSWATGKLL